jgi:hypothetical protein
MHPTIFGEVSYRVSVVLTWKVHGVAKIYPITWLLASLDAQPVGSVISLHYLGCPSPIRVDRGHQEEFLGMCHCGALEPVKESRQGSVQRWRW